VTTDLINFIIVTCKIWRKIGLGHQTSMAETKTSVKLMHGVMCLCLLLSVCWYSSHLPM